MTVGRDSGQPGNAVPLSGGGAMRQVSSAADALTITLASGVDSTAGGQGLVVRRNYAAGTSGGTELFVAEYDGVRGRRHIVTLSTACEYTVSSAQSGAFFVIPAMASGVTITLPAAEQGLWYEFYVAGVCASGVITIAAPTCGTMVLFNDSAADAFVFGKAGAASGTVAGGAVRFYADGSQWLAIPQPGFTSQAPTSATMNDVAIVS